MILNLLKQYGTSMLKFYPDQTHKFIKEFILSCLSVANTEHSIKYEKLVSIYFTFDHLCEDILDFIISKDNECQCDILHRRIELCLERIRNENSASCESKIEEILQDKKLKYDQDYLLTLFKTYNYSKGTIMLAEMMNLRQELLVVYMDNHDYDKIIDVCKGCAEKNFWIQALSYFISLDLNSFTSAKIMEILSFVLENEIITPFVVLDLFKGKSEATFELIQNYIIELMEKEIEVIGKNQSEFLKNEEVQGQFNGEIINSRTKAIKINLSKCVLCKLPTVLNQNQKLIVFMCNHIYHAECYNYEVKDEKSAKEITDCPQCLSRAHVVNQRILQSLEKADKHNEFKMELDSKTKKFDQIAKYLGLGIFGNS